MRFHRRYDNMTITKDNFLVPKYFLPSFALFCAVITRSVGHAKNKSVDWRIRKKFECVCVTSRIANQQRNWIGQCMHRTWALNLSLSPQYKAESKMKMKHRLNDIWRGLCYCVHLLLCANCPISPVLLLDVHLPNSLFLPLIFWRTANWFIFSTLQCQLVVVVVIWSMAPKRGINFSIIISRCCQCTADDGAAASAPVHQTDRLAEWYNVCPLVCCHCHCPACRQPSVPVLATIAS